MNPILILLILIGVFNAFTKTAKKKTQAAGTEKKATPVPPHTARRVMKNIDPSIWAKVDQAASRNTEKHKTQAVPAWKSSEGEDPCHDDMLRGVKPQGQEEGADPCHEYMLNDTAPEGDAPSPADDAQELLRGIILSEILKRPRSVYSRR